MHPKISLIKKDGKLKWNEPAFTLYVNGLKDGNYKVQIVNDRKTRSENQNRYYFGYIIKTYSSHVDVRATPKETHDFLREEIISYNYECPLSKEVRMRVKSTTELNTKEFEQYLEQCRNRFYEDYGIVMKLPNETEFNY